MFQGFFVCPACDIFDYLCQKHKKSIPQKQIMVIFTCLSPAKGSWLSLRSLCGLFLVIRSKIAFKARLVVLAYNYIPLTVKTSHKRFCEVLQPAFKISFLLTQQFCKKLCSKYTLLLKRQRNNKSESRNLFCRNLRNKNQYGFLTALIFKISPLNHRYFFHASLTVHW